MNCEWYIQDANLPERDNLQRIIYFIEEMGMKVHVRPYIPFGGMDYSFLPINKPVIALSSIAAVKNFQRRNLPYKPFAWFDQEKLRCSHCYAYYDKELITQRYAFYPLNSILTHWDSLFHMFGSNGNLFIKPDTNDKAFDGAVVKGSNYAVWEAGIKKYGEQDLHQLCLISTPVKIKSEWRLIVADDKVIAGSKYKENGMICKEEGYPEEAAQVAERLSRLWKPHPIFCMDIGLTEEGYKLIEIGSVNCAGFYKCDLKLIIKSLVEVAQRHD